MNKKSSSSQSGKKGFSSAFTSYDKKTSLVDQSTYGPYDTFSFNKDNDTASLADILGTKPKKGVGLVGARTVPAAAPKKDSFDSKKPSKSDKFDRKKSADSEFGKDRFVQRRGKGEDEEEPKKKELKTMSKGGVLTFIDDEDMDDQGNMKSITAGAEEVQKKKKKGKSGGFQSMDLHPEVFKGVMKMGFKVPTPIQRKSIPPLLEGNDVVAMARTGSGKTAAFAIPLLHKLATSDGPRGPMDVGAPVQAMSRNVRAVVLSPTRELAQQTFKVISQLGRFLGLRIVMLVGGQSLSQQFELLSQHPDVLVATPGRLVHHLVEVQFSLQDVQFCCFDEADRLFEMGFAQQLYEILKRMGDERQTCLFSATMPKALVEFSRAGLKNPISIRLDSEAKLSPDLQVSFPIVRSKDKMGALIYLLTQVVPEDQQAIVFASTKYHVDFITQVLTFAHISAVCVYGDLDSEARVSNIAKFRHKDVRVMVVTDVAARGIDIPLLDNVINYDFPSKPKLFIHRCGRVARAGSSGTAYSLVAPNDMPYLIDLYLFFAWRMPLLEHLDVKAQTDALAKLIKESKDKANEKKDIIIGGYGKDAATDVEAPKTIEIDGIVIEQPDDVAEEDDEAEETVPDTKERVVELGRFPATLMDPNNDYVHSIVVNHDLERLEYSVDLAFNKYLKNRESASAAATRRWKEASQPGIHPAVLRVQQNQGYSSEFSMMGLGSDADDLVSLDNALASLSNFTPKQTIFELLHSDGEGNMRQKRREHDYVIQKRLQGNSLPVADGEDEEEEKPQSSIVKVGSGLAALMAVKAANGGALGEKKEGKTVITAAERRKRKKLEEKVKKGELTREEMELQLEESKQDSKRKKTQDNKDTNYISLQPQNDIAVTEGLSINKGRMEDMVLDLDAEDDEGARKAKKVERWDSRKKRFVTNYEKKDVFGKNIINESGQRVRADAPSGQLYEEWQRKNRKRGAFTEDMDGKDMRNVARRTVGSKKGGKAPQGDIGVKSKDEVRKARQQREVNKVRHAKKDKGPSKKGDKGGRGGKGKK